jgi:hypothetical protein
MDARIGIETSPLLFAWPTAGRRESLSRSVASFAENLASRGRNPDMAIFLDSSDEGESARVLSLAKEATARYGMTLRLCDARSREGFARLLSADFDPEILSYALSSADYSGERFGRIRNAILLAGAGGIAITTDDDVLCKPACRKDFVAGIVASRNPSPHEVFFLPNREALLSRVTEVDRDIAGEHLGFLGKRAEDLFDASDLPSGSEVLLTVAGSYGDSGFARARAPLSLTGISREALMNEGYETCRLSREVIRLAERDVVGTGMHLMAMHAGFDARDLLPPFIPFGRNEDGLFSIVLRMCRMGSLSAFPGFGLLHDPDEPRAFVEGNQTEYAPGLVDVLMSIVVASAPAKAIRDGAERMSLLGDVLAGMDSIDDEDFSDFAHGAWSVGAEAYAASLERLLAQYGRKPDAWARDVDAHLEKVYALMRDASALFGPLGCGLSPDIAKSQVAEFGSLLAAWPDIFARSRELNAAEAGLVSLSHS